MTIYHGNDGVVKVSTNTVGEVQEFTYDEEDVAMAEQTSMGDTIATPVASGCKRGKGTVSCLLDEDDTNGQLALLVVGATVDLNLYGEGAAAGDFEYGGNVVITGVSRAVSKSELNKITFSFNGVLTRAAVPS